MKESLRTVAGVAAAVGLLAVSTQAEARRAVHDTSPVWGLPGVAPQIADAEASITRSNGGVTIRFDSAGLGPHHAVTLWSVSFDHPEHCEHGGPLPDGRTALCGPGDDGADDTGFTIQQVAGHVLGANGNADFAGHVEVEDPFGAEFHVVLADHGPMDPAQLPGQIKSPAPGTQIAFFVP